MAVDLLRGFLQRPAVGMPPGRTGPQAIAPGELISKLPVTHPGRAHLLPKRGLFGPQAGFRVRHVRSPSRAVWPRNVSGVAVNVSRPASLMAGCEQRRGNP